MAIEKLDSIKIKQCNLPFSLISTNVIQSINNAEALAVWVYLSTKPSDWIIRKKELQNHFNFGEDKIDSIFSYLKKIGLLIYFRERDEKGRLGKSEIHILCGDVFNDSTGVKITPMVSTGVKTTRVENHPRGKHPPYKIKRVTKEIKEKNKDKSSCEQKEENKKRHEWAAMKNETESIRKNEELKIAPMPQNLRDLIDNMKIGNLSK